MLSAGFLHIPPAHVPQNSGCEIQAEARLANQNLAMDRAWTGHPVKVSKVLSFIYQPARTRQLPNP